MNNEETLKKGRHFCRSHHLQRSKEALEKQTKSKSNENSKIDREIMKK
ncbi:hypothetical protein [Peribacillus sp. NPDC097895]